MSDIGFLLDGGFSYHITGYQAISYNKISGNILGDISSGFISIEMLANISLVLIFRMVYMA